MKMLSEQECLKEYEKLSKMIVGHEIDGILTRVDPMYEDDLIVYKQLIKEHFELIKEHKKVQLEAQRYFDELCEGGWHDKEYHEFKNPQPYKFEDLKHNMWVWDDVDKVCRKLESTAMRTNWIWFYIDESEKETIDILFEEGRFFPVTKALEYQK